MGGGASMRRRSSLGLLTPEEKAQLHAEEMKHQAVNQNTKHYVIDYLYYMVPVTHRRTAVERLRGVNGAIRPPPDLSLESLNPPDVVVFDNDIVRIPVTWIEVDREKLEKAYSATAADRLMGFYCRGVGIDERGNLYVQPRHRPDTMLFLHGEQLQRCQTVPAAPEPPTFVSATRTSVTLSWALPQTEDHPLGIVDKFEVQYQREATGSYTWIALATRDVLTSAEDLTQHEFSGQLPDHGFRFRVRCHNRWGWGEFSKPSPIFCTMPDRPPRPGKPFPSLITSTTVVLHWRPFDSTAPGGACSPRSPRAMMQSAASSLRTRYVLRVRDKDGHVTLHQTGPLTCYVLSELSPGGTYHFEVEASNVSGVSGYSQPLTLRLRWRDPLPSTPQQQPSFYTRPPQAQQQQEQQDSSPAASLVEEMDHGRPTNLADFEFMLRAGENWIELWEPVAEHVFYFNVITSERVLQPPPELLSLLERRQQQQQQQQQAPPQQQVDGSAPADGHQEEADAAARQAQDNSNGQRGRTGSGSSSLEANTIFRNKRAHFWRCLHKSSGAVSPKSNLLLLSVKRSSVLIDTFMAFMDLQPRDLRKRTNVHFDGEEGIDSGGLTKDWYMAVSRALRAPSHHRFFRTTAAGRLEIEFEGVEQSNESRIEYFRFMGKFIAKAIFDRQNVDLPLCLPLYKHMLQLPVGIDDVEELDSALCRSLKWMCDNEIEGVLFEKFSVLVKRKDGKEEELELCEKGTEKDVTDENKKEYVQLMTQWRTKFAVCQELEALLEGMQLILNVPSLKDFTVEELDLLLNGQREVAVEQVRAYCIYQGGFHEKHIVVLWLWQALAEFSNEQRCKFLKFVTGSDRVPLDGFTPLFNITEGVDMDRDKDLPKSHTCFNQLVLPAYRSYGLLHDKVLYAIENSEGFAMT